MTEQIRDNMTQGAISKVELENLYLKQKLPIQKIAQNYGYNHNFKIYELLKEFNIKIRNHSEALKGKPMTKKRSKLLSKKMSTNLAYLFGAIKGDGHIDKRFVHVTTCNFNFAKILKQKIIEWSGLNCSIKNYKTGSGGFLWYVFLNSIEAVDLFKSLSISSLTTNEEKSNFVRGFADAEGSVTIFNNWNNKYKKYRRNYKVAIYNSDKELIYGIQNLLFSLGINSSIYKRLPKNSFGKRIKYELVISHKSVKKFAEIIGFSYPEKAEKLNKIIGGE